MKRLIASMLAGCMLTTTVLTAYPAAEVRAAELQTQENEIVPEEQEPAGEVTEDTADLLTTDAGDSLEAGKILDMEFEGDTANNAGDKEISPAVESGTPEYVTGHDETGQAIELNGAKISLGNSEKLQPKDLTLSFWVKAPEGGYQGEQILLWCKEQSSWDKDGWYLTLNLHGAVNLMIGKSHLGFTGTTKQFFPEGEWVHVVAVYSSETKEIDFYRNGIKQTTNMKTTGDGVINPTEGNKYVGKSGYSPSNMTGAIDDLQIYNAAATQEQVEELCGIHAEEKLAEAADALELGDNNQLFYDTTLQSKGLWGSNITWSLKEASEAVFVENGNKAIVTRGSEDIGAVLVATISLGEGGTSVDKEFDITIPSQKRESVSKAVTFNNVVLKDKFWSAQQKQFLCKVINTGITNIEAYRGGIDNLRNAAIKNGAIEQDASYDPCFRSGEKQDGYADNLYFLDTDPYKMIEAMSYALQIDPAGDEEIIAQQDNFRDKLNTWIPYIEGAQEKYEDESGAPADNEAMGQYDGYLDTYFTLDMASNPNRPAKLTNFHDHEMYCFGHFYEAAVAYTRGTQYEDLRLLDVAVRNADMMNRLFGRGKWESYPGHQEIELALVKLAQVCQEVGERNDVDYASKATDYVNLAKFFLDKRGYEMTHGGFVDGFANDPYYRQNHAPVAEQTTAVGHAVRAMYQYTAMTDVETLIDSDTYDNALHSIWDDLQTKTYVTGGIGSKGGSSSSEGFGDSYYLPNNNAYAETCANIGSMMWSQRMNLLYSDSKYIDTLETALYNSVISGVNFDGDKFFYQNPMSSTGNLGRSPWFGCACCPPNLMRTITALGGYIYAQDGSSVAVNLYIGNEADITVGGQDIKLSMETDMPWYGNAKLTIQNAENAAFALKLRIPEWAAGANSISVNGETISCGGDSLDKGYAVISRTWNTGDIIEVTLPMETEKYHSDERVASNKGLAAVKRGPIVYAAEGKDNAFKVSNAYLGNSFKEELVDNVLTNDDSSQPNSYGTKRGLVIHADGSIYTSGAKEDAEWTFIPYYAWNNRGSDTMQVFVRDQDALSLEQQAAVDTIYYNPKFNQIDKINDGDVKTFWCCWKEGEVLKDPWVSYTFDKYIKVKGCIVNWYDDGDGAQVPKGLRIEYLDRNGDWKEVSRTEDYTEFVKDQDNRYEFDEVVTKGLRMTMLNEGKSSAAIREWKLDADTEFTGLEEAMEVLEKIEALPSVEEVTLDDRDSVTEAMDKFESLSDEQKALIGTEMQEKLTALADKIEELEKPDIKEPHWEKDQNGWWYDNGDGTRPASEWKIIEGKWYYFNPDGYRMSGWIDDHGTWFYCNQDGIMQTGWLLEGKTWYYLKGNGAMATGWLQLGNTWYYLKSSGGMVTGWLQLGNTWYYLKSSGSMVTGWLLEGKTWYYLKNSGAMATGWLLDGKTWYYLKSSGAMATGWLLDGKTWYYLKSNGAMATGWVKVSGKWYYLRDNGAMASKTWIGNYYVNASGVWTKTR